MTGSELRKKFLDFFKSKGSAIVKSDSLVPKDDPTVLFTTAGMQQFKPQFLGQIDDYTQAATSQKCLRTDDLDEVGETDFHHTFFEMLGNFSFGDYFKKEAIAWGWEFLTKVLEIPEDKLWVSVHEEDDEAYQIWLNEIKVPAHRIVKLGDKDNFWPANARKNGPNGPCGPCSEIFYDWGPQADGSDKDSDPGTDQVGRFCEVWNLVFTQYNRKDGGELEPLPSKNIDTGMGLERLTAVMQGTTNNFESDLFAPIIEAISKANDEHKGNLSLKSKRIIADHIRAVTFGIADGVIPSNEGRGYIMRRLIVDMSDLLLQAGIKKPIVYTLAKSVVDKMQDQYPELVNELSEIKAIIKPVEVNYLKVAKERIPELKLKLKEQKDPNALGEVFFRFRDTFGLTQSTIVKVAQEEELSQDILDQALAKFDELMEEQRSQARAKSKMTGDVFTVESHFNDIEKTTFVGYMQDACSAKIIKILKDNAPVESVSQGDRAIIVLDQTPFYAESGGQVGDIGFLTKDNGVLQVTDTQKTNDIFLHTVLVDQGEFQCGDEIVAAINNNRRNLIRKNHTATHLLQASLTKILGDHVKQQGSLVDEGRLRFDFSHGKAIGSDQIEQIEQEINAHIQESDDVLTEELPIEQAQAKGARAYFAEKYGDTVRVVSIKDYSIEFCGGTHVNNTKDIGALKITSQSAVAQGIRRIEAVTDKEVDVFIQAKINEFLERIKLQEKRIENLLSQVTDTNNLPKRATLADSPNIEECRAYLKDQAEFTKVLNKKLQQVRFESIKNDLDNVIAQVKDNTLIHVFNDVDMNILRQISDSLKQKLSTCLLILFGKTEDNLYLLVAASDDMIEKGVKANEVIKDIAPLIDGQGGGRPQLAQAGCKSPEKLDQAWDEIHARIAKVTL